MLFVYSAPDLRFVCATGNKGNGPDEFPSIPFLIDSQTDSIYVFGYGLRYLKSMAVDSAAGVRLTERYALLFHEAFNSMHLLKDSVLVYQTVMPPQYSIKRKYNLRQNEMIGELKMERESPQEELAWDLSRGKMAANDSVIVYVYLYKNQIDLYDLETLELKKRIVGEYKPQQPTFKDEELYYVSAFAGKNIFMLCSKASGMRKVKIRAIRSRCTITTAIRWFVTGSIYRRCIFIRTKKTIVSTPRILPAWIRCSGMICRTAARSAGGK